MFSKIEGYLNIILSIICMVFLIYIGTTIGNNMKIDVTQEGLYTLSDGSKKILKQLNQPLKIKLYYSKTAANKGTEGIRAFNNYYSYIRDLLEEYVSYSQNNLTLYVIDPRPDTKQEEDAIASGLKKFPLSETEKYFFGLVIENETGAEKIIEFFNPSMQESVEYEITKLVYSATNPKKIKLGILSSIKVLNKDLSPYMAQMMRMQGKRIEQSWIITKILEEFYDVVEIKNNQDNISAVDLLLVIHPKNLSNATKFAIDQFLLKGGKVCVLVDPLSVAEQSTQNMSAMRQAPDFSLGLKEHFYSWGIIYDSKMFAGDKNLAAVRKVSQFDPPMRLLPVVECDGRCSKDSDIISQGLNRVTLIYPGVLKVDKSKNKNLKYSKIISTTEKGNSYHAMPYELSNPQALLNKFVQGTEPVVMGYKIIGKFKTAFPKGIQIRIPDEQIKGSSKKIKTKNMTGVMESIKESAVVIIADVDFIHDQNAFQKTVFGVNVINNNSTLLLNSLENLAGSNELMSIRSKGKISRSFDVIDEIEFDAKKETEDKVKQINQQITLFTRELNELGRKGESISLIQNEGIKKKKQLAKRIALLKSELREVKREGREKIESIGENLQLLNTIFIPALILLILGFFYWLRRHKLKQG